MGYSCTVDASHTLGVIGHMFATNGNSNVLTIRDTQYFFERGKEQADGAITGKLMEMLPDDFCKSAGTVRIEPDGTITRFPRLKVAETTEIEDTRREVPREATMTVSKTKVNISFDSSELPLAIAALLNHLHNLPEPNRTVGMRLHQRMLATYHSKFNWKEGKQGPSYAAAAAARNK